MRTPPALTDAEIRELDHLLAQVPAPLEALEVSSLDGFLCGVLLQSEPIAEDRWWPWVLDVDGRGAAGRMGKVSLERLRHLVRRRHAELDHCVEARRWFDPWVFDVEDPHITPAQMTLPWAAGFAMAMEQFPDLMDRLDATDPDHLEPLAVLYAAFDPEDLEDAEDLRALIDTLEPASTLDEAVEDLVRSVLLLADVARPRAARTPGA